MFNKDLSPLSPVNAILSDELVPVGLAEGDVSGYAVMVVKLSVHLGF